MDTYTIFGLESRGYGHGYKDQKKDSGNQSFIVIEHGSVVGWTEKVYKKFCLFIIRDQLEEESMFSRSAL